MSTINKRVLDDIDRFKNNLFRASEDYFNYLNLKFNYRLEMLPQYWLNSLIAENVRMDLNYLLSLNLDYDIFGFPGIQRNIRNSIEAFYDLFNLTKDNNYINVLKYSSRSAEKDESVYNYVDVIAKQLPLKGYTKKNGKIFYNFTITVKADIAKMWGMSSEAYSYFKGYSTNANAFVHPDIFSKSRQDKEQQIEELLNADCFLLTNAFIFLMEAAEQKYGYKAAYNPSQELFNLQNALLGYHGQFILP